MNLGLGESQTEATMSLSLCGMIVWETEGAWVPGRVPVEAAAGTQEEKRTGWQREKRLSRDTGAPCTKHVWRIWAAWEGG